MAGIDKIIGTRAQYHELRDWLMEAEPWYAWSIVDEDRYRNETEMRTISNFSRVEDFYLWHICPIPWVKTRLIEQYGPQGPCSDRDTPPQPDALP
jgi:hypothetical protein